VRIAVCSNPVIAPRTSGVVQETTVPRPGSP
jgi:hypothetical protein